MCAQFRAGTAKVGHQTNTDRQQWREASMAEISGYQTDIDFKGPD